MKRIKGGRKPFLKSRLNKDGYLQVGLSVEGRSYSKLIHRVLCQVFHGDPPFEGAQALHQDDNKQNNTPENLYWGTHQQNMDDMRRHGNTCNGARSGLAKLTWETVGEIRRLATSGVIPNRIAKQFGISHRHATLIIRNEMWRT